jgi:hypothetical protein
MSKAAMVVLMWAIATVTPVMASQPTIIVEASGSIVDGKPMIVFKVTNTANQPVQVAASQLPWTQRNNVVITVVNKKSGEPARPKLRIDDNFDTGVRDIGAGQSMQGVVSLDRYVAGVQELLKKGDLLVFWYYNAPGDASALLGEQGGWFVLSRGQNR